MNNLQISIYTASSHLLESITPEPRDDLYYHYEMFAGVRYCDFEAQVKALQEQGLSEDTQDYTLLCTYIKCGSNHQETMPLPLS